MLQNQKLFGIDDAVKIRNQRRDRCIVLTNGCFDLLHVGHVFSLQQAAKLGELWVALNGDTSIRQLKGPFRPIMSEKERAYMLSALDCVSGIFIFNGQHLIKELENFCPDIYVKSTDYTPETLNLDERDILKKIGTKIEFVSFLKNFSTSAIIKACRQIDNNKVIAKEEIP